MNGLKVLVTAGAMREAINPVRYITNHSTRKDAILLNLKKEHQKTDALFYYEFNF